MQVWVGETTEFERWVPEEDLHFGTPTSNPERNVSFPFLYVVGLYFILQVSSFSFTCRNIPPMIVGNIIVVRKQMFHESIH